MIRRGATAAAALALALVASATVAAAAVPATEVTGVTAAGAHAVRVDVRAPGDLTATGVSARLGSHWAYVQSVQPLSSRLPLHLVIALDSSDSMRGPSLAAAEASARELLQTVGARDQAALVTFARHVQVPVALTHSVATVEASLGTITTGPGTALNQGVAQAVEIAGSGGAARRVVVLISDGAGTAGGWSALQHELAASGVQVDTVGLIDSKAFTAEPLERIAAASGGTFVKARSPSALRAVAARLRDRQLSGSYAAVIQLPQTEARDLHVSVLGGTAASVRLPAGVSGESSGFWLTHGSAVIALLGFAAVLSISLTLLRLGRSRRPSLSARLSDYGAMSRPAGAEAHASTFEELYEQVEHRFSGSLVWRQLDTLCRQAGLALPTAQVLLGIAALASLGGVLGEALLGVVAGVVGAIVLAAAPILVLRWKAARRSAKFDAQLPELLSVWASALRAGRSFAQALDSLVDEAEEPALGEFRRAQHQVRLGVAIEQALDDMCTRLRSDSFELVVLTTDVQRRVGGNVAAIFDQVADTVRRRQQFSSRVRALTSMGRLSAYVLIALPFALALALTLIDADYMAPLYETSVGHLLIAIALAMMTLGWLVLRRLVKPRVTA